MIIRHAKQMLSPIDPSKIAPCISNPAVQLPNTFSVELLSSPLPAHADAPSRIAIAPEGNIDFHVLSALQCPSSGVASSAVAACLFVHTDGDASNCLEVSLLIDLDTSSSFM